MNSEPHIRFPGGVAVMCASVLLAFFFAFPSIAAPVDCDEIWTKEKSNTYEVAPKDLRECMMRGWDPPVEWRPNDGKSPGIKVGGSGGFSYGATTAPTSPAGARDTRASVSRNVIKSTCEFPPRVKIGFPPKLQFPKGSCYDFFNDLLKDKDGGTYSSPPPTSGVSASDKCPVESDTTGTYGVKQSVVAGGLFAAPCGGMIPINNGQLTLNRGANFFAITRNGSYRIDFYRKSGASYVNYASSTMPHYLCHVEYNNESGTYYTTKSVDLTATAGQIITFNPGDGYIDVRLQSREFMPSEYIPPYDANVPENYIVVRLDGAGNPSVPSDCADDASGVYVPLSMRRDITLEPSYTLDAECQTVSVDDTMTNDPIVSCPPGMTLGGQQCRDPETGATAAPTLTDNWVAQCPCTGSCVTCPDGSAPKNGKCTAPAGGCPQNAGVPATTASCPNSADPSHPTAPVNGQCPSTCTGPASASCTALGGFTIEPTSCGSAQMLCDVTTLSPTFATDACKAKSQYAVLNRPNLYFPEGTSAKVYPIAGLSFGVVDTVANSQFFASGSTTIYLSSTAPAVTLNEGGQLKLKDGSVLIMNPTATIDASAAKVTFNGGGQRVSAGGKRLVGFARGDVFPIPAALNPGSMKIKMGRSVFLPNGFILPTGSVPYMRLPVDKPST